MERGKRLRRDAEGNRKDASKGKGGEKEEGEEARDGEGRENVGGKKRE